MKKSTEGKIRSRKVSIVLMEYIVVLGCLLVAFVMISGKKIEQTNSYAKPEEVSRYEVVEDEYLTRVRPLTEYATFKEIAENSLNKIVTVYTNETKTEEVVDGVITSGMVVEAEEEGEVAVLTQNRTYTVRVIGDLTGNGDCNVTELTRIIRHIVGIERFSKRGEEISADFNGDDVINVVDITKCINYIVYGKMDPDEEEVKEPKIEVKEIGEEEERDNNWYNGDVEVRIVEQGEGISKIQTIVEREGNKERTEEREITLTDAGVYKISSQSHGENGTKSRVVEKEINIDKTIPELEISREDVDMTQCKIIIRARDNGGIRKYSIQRNGEEERSKEGIDQKELNGYVTIRENGVYKVTIEDKAGNKVEEEIEITDLNNRYTVTFKNEDGSVISQRNYDQGATVEVPQNPSKIEDNTYTYEFAGWNPEVEEIVTENKEYTATYRETYKNYTVTFKDEDGTIITTKNDYHYGDIVAVPENPTKPEDETNTYRFIGWDKELSTVVEGNVEYKAVYEATRKEYTITFKDENGEILLNKTDYHYGERIAVPQNPSKAEDNTYTYEFIGWSPKVQETVTENKEYTATYTSTYKNYTVTFKDENGNIITTKNDYHYGDTVAVPENPTKPEDETNTYRFIGWDKEVSTVVEGNVEYKAVYEATRKEYTITFKDENGTVLSNKTDYHYGERIAVPQNPTKQEDNTYTYEFTGWNEAVQETVTENKEYIATYSATYKNYTVIFKDEDGKVLVEKRDYHYGDIVTVPENPSKAEDNTNTYEFVGWNQEVQETVIENKEYIATYTSTYKNYTVTFKNEDGTVLTSKSDYHYGDTVAIPQNPTKAEDETYIYEFTGWNESVQGTVTESKEYTATYTSTYKNYTVTFKDEDGTIITTKNDYHYGDTVTIPESPTKAEDETYTYEFKGWTPEIVITEEEPKLKVKENIEYTATYEAKYKEYVVTFKQDSGEILSNLGYHYGDMVQIPEDPHKLSTMEYAYTFTGWNRVEEGGQTPVTKEEIQTTPVTKEVEYIATYEAEKINYTLIFYNDDYNEETGEGTLIEERTYEYGQTITFPEAQKEETEEIRYVFDGWENLGTEEESPVQINIKFKAKYREEYYVARLDPIIQDEQTIVEGKSYLTLKEAVEEAGRVERTIRMLKDTEESVLVEDDQNITINLNGKTITAKKTYVIKNYGELKIVNNSDNEGKILEISEEEIGYGIYNREGKVSIQSGTIAAETSKENGRTYAIYNKSEEPVLVEGGIILADAKGENSIGAGIYNLSGKETIARGGVILGNAIGERATTYGIYNETDGKVRVEEGTLVEGKASLQSATSYGIYNKISQEVEITGGKVIAQSDKGTAYGIYNEEGKVEITGGEIEVPAYTGYGIYNDKGTIESENGKINMVSNTSYGIYNNAGILNFGIGNVDLQGVTTYGIYNKNNMEITGGKINNKTAGSKTYGVYNETEEDIAISNIIVTGTERGIWNTKGNMALSEINITSTEGIYTGGTSGNVTVNSGIINVTRNGINNNVGTVILRDITINSESFGVYTTNSGNTEIGTKDNTINTEKPYIYGKTYGVCMDLNQSGNIKFYDGVLQGQNAIYGGISCIEVNSKIKVETIENNEQTEERATLETIPEIQVAKIGNTTYKTLADAIDAVAENQEEPTTIEIIEDFDNSIVTEVPEDKNIKLDLKGHTINTNSKGGIINKGTLEITDTKQYEETEEHTGKIDSTIGIGITNDGKFTLTEGIIESNGYGIQNNNEVIINGGKINAVNSGIYNSSNANVKINNGIIKSDNNGIKSFGIINLYNGEIIGNNTGISQDIGSKVNVLNGIVSGDLYGIDSYYGNTNVANGKISASKEKNNSNAIRIQYGTLVLTGGEIVGQSGIRNTDSDVTVGIKGGNVDNTSPVIIGKEYGIYNLSNGSINKFKFYDGKIAGKEEAIYGDIADVEDDKEIAINTEIIYDEEYKVASLVNETRIEEGIAQIGETIYKTASDLKKAISEIPVNTEEPVGVKILNDFNASELLEIKNYQNIVIDLNGKTITIQSSIVNNGNLEITDSTEAHEGKIVGQSVYVIDNNTGNLIISKGTIEGNNYGIRNNYAYITIGTEDGIVDDDLVVVKSKNNYALFNTSSYKVKMFDGKLIGKYNNVTYISEVENNYKAYAYQENEYYITTLQLEDPVASTGGVDYYSLQEAFDNCENGNKVTILRDIELKNTVTVSEGKEIVLDLKGYKICSNSDITLINNGALSVSNSNGDIQNTANEKTVVQNNGTLNLNNGYIQNRASASYHRGTAVENNGILNVQGGTIVGYTYGISNKENGILNIKSGYVNGDNCAIYNDSENEINITGGQITSSGSYEYRSSYGIYNNAKVNININNVQMNIYGYANLNDSYAYGIYNNSEGNILLSGENTSINAGRYGGYGCGIYNNGNGNITVENGSISANECKNFAYGIKNVNKGNVEIKGGNINTSSPKGMAYGIENGISGKVEMTGGKIKTSTTEGTAYGINNMSIQQLKIKSGEIKAEGANSYGIYNNTSDLTIGENDDEVIINNPIIESDNIGIYVHTTDTKFGFYDGRITGIQAMNTDVNLPEGYKILEYTDESTNKQSKTLMEEDAHIATFWNEDKTQVIAKVPFKSTDREIQEPIPPEREGYIGYWTYYEIKDEDIETQLYYVIKRTNGTQLQATDEYGLTWNYTYRDGEAINVYYQSGTLQETVNIPARLDGYPVYSLYNSSGNVRNIFVKTNSGTNTTVKNVIIPKGIKVLDNYAFWGCRELVNIEISQSVRKMGEYIFSTCYKLSNVKMPNYMDNIGNNAFWGCYSLTCINIPDGVQILKNYTFSGCTNLRYIKIPNSLTNIGISVFYNCNSLISIILPNVTSIGNSAFYNCGKLSDIYFNNLEEEITFENNWKLGTNAFVHFKDCSHKLEIVLESGYSLEEITDNRINEMIKCGETYKFRIRSNQGEIKKDSLKIMIQGTYTNSETAEKTIYPDDQGVYTISNIERNIGIGRMSGEKYKATDKNGITWNYTYENGEATNVYYEDGILGERVEIPTNLDTYPVTSIKSVSTYHTMQPKNIFNESENTTVKEIIIPEGIKEISYLTFYKCTALENVVIPGTIESIGSEAFQECYNLSRVKIQKGVKIIEQYAFRGDKMLESIEIPSSVTKIETGAFEGCGNIKYLYVDEDNANYSSENNILYNKDKTNLIRYGGEQGDVEVKEGIIELESYSFSGCNELKSIKIPSSVINVGQSVFSGCYNLEDIYFDNFEENIEKNYYFSTGNAFVHYNDCKHLINTEILLDGIEIISIEGNIEEGKIKCGSTYKFKIIDKNGEVITDKPVKIITQGRFTNSEDEIENIDRDENGIYTIEKIERNKTIRIGKNDGEQGQATDENGITWNYTYQGGNATSVYYESGELGRTVDIPSELDGFSVTNLYNSKLSDQGNIFATYYWEENRSIERVNIPKSVTNISYNAFSYCSNLSDIYVDNEQYNILDTGWQYNILDTGWQYNTNAFIHYRNCTHTIEFNLNTENIKVIAEDTEDEINNTSVNCGDTIKFRLLDTTDSSIIYNKKLYIKTQAKFRNLDDILEIILPDENGVYTIENINRNKSIIENPENGMKMTVTDGNNITWQFTYQDGKAEDVHYYDGELGENVEIPSELNGYPVVSLYNTKWGGNKNIFATNTDDYSGIIKVVRKIKIPDSVIKIGRRAFFNCVSINNINIPISVTRIEESVFGGCISLTNIYIDNLEENIELSDDINQYGYVHYSDCKHDIAFEKYTNEEIELQTVGEKGQNGHIECNENYKFKLVDTNGNPVTSEKVLVRYAGLENEIDENERDYYDRVRRMLDNSSNMFASDEEGISELQVGEDGIYTVEKVHRNITIIVGSYQTTDENNITWNYSIKDGKALNVYYEGGDLGETVTIPSELDGHQVESLYNKEESGSIFGKAENPEVVKNVIIQNGVEKIDQYAFYKLGSLETITIPDTVTEIGYASFYDCKELREINIPNGVTKIGGFAFNCCIGLSNIVIPNSVTELGIGTFSSCNNLESITLPSNLETIPDYLFINCEKLNNVQIPETITSIGNRAFYNCYNIENLIIPDTVTEIKESVFYNCSNLQTIKLSNTITSIENQLFGNCYSLTDIIIPEGVTIIKEYSFGNCRNLEKIEIPNSVTKIEAAFSGCNNLKDIYINNDESGIDINAYDGKPWYPWYNPVNAQIHYNDCTHSIKLRKYIEDSTEIESVEEGIDNENIPCRSNYQFKLIKDGEVIQNKTITITELGTTKYYDVEKEIEPNEEGIYTIEKISRNCIIAIGERYQHATDENGITWEYEYEEGKATNVHYYSGELSTEVEIPSTLDGYLVESIYKENNEGNPVGILSNGGWNVYGQVKSIKIPEGVTSIGNNAFIDCSKLENIELPNTLSSIGEKAFMMCHHLKIINLSDRITNIGSLAFRTCDSLENIELPENLTEIEESLFYGCSNLKNITIKDNVTEIKVGAFGYCSSLEELIIPNSVTKIERDAFRNCSNLSSVTMSKNVEYIGEAAFDNCTSLSQIVIWRNVEELGYRTFDNWTNEQLINFEVQEVQKGWDQNWNYNCNAQIEFGYTGE